jgi:serine/threonine protein kinase
VNHSKVTDSLISTKMATWKRTGRASDMFSLGCVLLEIVILHDQGTLNSVRLHRSADPAFHANLDRIDSWFPGPSPRLSSYRRAYLVSEIKSMLAHNPEVRPTAKELLIRVAGYDEAQIITSKHSLFGDCCRGHFMSAKEKAGYNDTIAGLRLDLQRALEELVDRDNKIERALEDHTGLSEQLLEEQVGFEIGSTKEHTDTS